MTILEEIFAHKRGEVLAQKERVPLPSLLDGLSGVRPPLNFAKALRQPGNPMPSLIAEVKKGSPSKGVLRQNFDPAGLARTYAANGAAAISVLTDERYFGGSLEYLRRIYELDLGVPLLRKEFICDGYQIFEARAAGADAILLIAACLSDHELMTFQALARRLGMAALVEVHTRFELARALDCGASLVGINNRNLHDFTVNLNTTRALRPFIPDGVVVVAESGIGSAADAGGLAVDAVLVGEALVRQNDAAAKVREFVNAGR